MNDCITINGNGQSFVDSLKDRNEVFDMEITNSTVTIYIGEIKYKYTIATKLKNHELSFIKKVKKYCETNITPIESQRDSIKYVHHGRIKTGYIYKKDIYEIDLNKAYWNYAYKQKYISREIYLQGLKVSKEARLIALGNLARKLTKLSFNGKHYETIDVIFSHLTEGIFFDVAKLTDVSMQKLSSLATSNYLFYWVDAIFITGEETLKRLEWFLNDYDLAYKVKKIYSLQKKKDKVIVKDDKFSRPDGTKEHKKGYREFNFQKSNIIKIIHDGESEETEETIQIRNSQYADSIQNFLSEKRETDSI